MTTSSGPRNSSEGRPAGAGPDRPISTRLAGRVPRPVRHGLAFLLVAVIGVSAWLWLEGTRPADLRPATASGAGMASDQSAARSGGTAELSFASASAGVIGDGTWAATGSPPIAVWGAGSAVLRDGRILVVGGATSSDSHFAVAAASLYDPAAGGWSAATAMLQARTYPAVAVLHDGSVLVAGGSRNATPLDTAERWYPQTGTWVAAGRMHVPRTHATATVLKDGRVLVAGGGTTGGPDYAATSTAELFDPTTGEWNSTGSMSIPRTLHGAALLGDGRVLVAGGADAYFRDGNVSASVELYDPAKGSWRQAASMAVPRYGLSALTLQDGRVLVAGGWSATPAAASSVASAEVYDPAMDRWSAAGSMAIGRAQFRMAELPDGRVVAAGGVSPNNNPLGSADLFDPRTSRWAATGRLPVAVYWPTLVALHDGRVLIAGGARNGSATAIWTGAALYAPPPR